MKRMLFADLVVGLLTGCGGGFDFELIHDDPHGASLSGDEVSLIEGRAVGIALREGGDPLDANLDVALHVVDGAVAGASAITTPDAHDYVLWGVSPGRTEIEILVEGEVEEVVPVTVLQ